MMFDKIIIAPLLHLFIRSHEAM